ncbi:hypothetical protein F5Y12DRAFT_718599 [Xylaria sp. FL1777]|nr:hypothetical protein F5Y12DRAFT_718599 [Xylaria sp. FL1777]
MTNSDSHPNYSRAKLFIPIARVSLSSSSLPSLISQSQLRPQELPSLSSSLFPPTTSPSPSRGAGGGNNDDDNDDDDNNNNNSSNSKFTLPPDHPLARPVREQQARAVESLYRLWDIYPWEIIVDPQLQAKRWSDNLLDRLVVLAQRTTMSWARTQLQLSINQGCALAVGAVNRVIRMTEARADDNTGTGMPSVPRNPRFSLPSTVTALSPRATRRRSINFTPCPTDTRSLSMSAEFPLVPAVQHHVGIRLPEQEEEEQGEEQEWDEEQEEQWEEHGGGWEPGQEQEWGEDQEVEWEEQQGEDQDNDGQGDDRDNPTVEAQYPIITDSFEQQGTPSASLDALTTNACYGHGSPLLGSAEASFVTGSKRPPSSQLSSSTPTKRARPSTPSLSRGSEVDGTMVITSIVKPTLVARNSSPPDASGLDRDILARFLSVPATRRRHLSVQRRALLQAVASAEQRLQDLRREEEQVVQQESSVRENMSSLKEEASKINKQRETLLFAEMESAKAIARLNEVRRDVGLPGLAETTTSQESIKMAAVIQDIQAQIEAKEMELQDHSRRGEKISNQVRDIKKQITEDTAEITSCIANYNKYQTLTERSIMDICELFGIDFSDQFAQDDANSNDSLHDATGSFLASAG